MYSDIVTQNVFLSSFKLYYTLYDTFGNTTTAINYLYDNIKHSTNMYDKTYNVLLYYAVYYLRLHIIYSETNIRDIMNMFIDYVTHSNFLCNNFKKTYINLFFNNHIAVNRLVVNILNNIHINDVL